MKEGKFVCVELFSGNADITKRLNNINEDIVCYSFDWEASYNPSFVKDLSRVTFKELCEIVGGGIDFIWASPDCSSYSVAAGNFHRSKGGVPHSEYAKFSDKLNTNLWDNVLLPSGVPFIVENPRGHYRNMPFAKHCFTRTVFYSTYGAEVQKPTDLFYNDFNLSNYIDFYKENFQHPRLLPKGTNLKRLRSGFLNRCKMPAGLLDALAEYVYDLYLQRFSCMCGDTYLRLGADK